ncbi:hypothetical protein [Cohnella rhizosphaerae]|uniref:Uncharacterized protein n=1 Tax=Cohnella rhizosphaerae TaxID=1457232 RepID=A0A9X4QRT9_9BACL|nr:hypothetical protein [Cohnella rhizosphaerae]MDG0808589.1 hypothetical protein [Cohnella rhizosphaerae]
MAAQARSKRRRCDTAPIRSCTIGGPDPREKLDRLASLGIGGIVTNVPWDDRYLQDERVFRELDAHLEAARDRGLGIWLYDEKGYPSGSADGLTLSGHPELQARGLYLLSVRGSGAAPAVVQLPEDGVRFYSASLHALGEAATGMAAPRVDVAEDGSRIRTNGMDGDWVLHAYVEKYLYEGTHAERNGWSPRRYPNLLDSRAVRRFIETTYEPYAAHIGQGRIGEAASAFFYRRAEPDGGVSEYGRNVRARRRAVDGGAARPV